ncbi:MAG: SHOCT domain-containing protein [Actinomycetota bacterium]
MTVAAVLLAQACRGFAFGPGPWWPIFPLLWLVLGGLAIFAIYRSRRSWWTRSAGASAESVLSERYARGEINEDEYRERLSVLKQRGS